MIAADPASPLPAAVVDTQPVIDCCIHHHWPSDDIIKGYLTRQWRAFVGESAIVPSFPYENPFGETIAAYGESTGPPGPDYEAVTAHVFGNPAIAKALLTHDKALYAAALPVHGLGVDVIRAVNDWTMDNWLGDANSRSYAAALVPTQLPDEAVKEVHRVAHHSRVVAIMLCANGLGKPFGDPIYHGIYKAAAEEGLVIAIHTGGDALPDTASAPTGGGLPGPYSEYYALAAQGVISHVTSMITQGVFEKFPDTRVLALGAGAGWVPAVFWRFDPSYLAMRRQVPWLKRKPSAYLLEHVRASTYPLDAAPTASKLTTLFESFPELKHTMCFASGYPYWDAATPQEVARSLPPDWVDDVLYRNAEKLFRWSAIDERTHV